MLAGVVTSELPRVGAVAAVMLDSDHALVAGLRSKDPPVATLSTKTVKVALSTSVLRVPGGSVERSNLR
jgi:hypothetical protein